jgi:WS/DGAT/MGAT family acyltransferase
VAYERLSARAASLLRRESPRSPLHAGSLALFDGLPFLDEHGRFRLDDVREHVAARLHRSPALRRRVQPVPFGQGRPVWVDDATFDLSYHVRLTALPRPGREEQLHALMARLQALPLDRRRPLWELWFVDGLQGDRVAVVQKTHLAMAEELGAVGALDAVLDEQPFVSPPEVPAWTAHKAPNNAALLARTLAERATRPREMVRTARAAVRGPRRALGAAGRRWRATVEIGHLRYEIVRADQPSGTDVGAVVRSLDPRAAITFEHLEGPRFFLGARLLEVFPSAPRAGAALVVSVLSYDGRLGIGLTGDRVTNGELRGLADGLGRAFGGLRVAAS